MFAFARGRRRLAVGAFALGLVAVVIVACGDDDPTPVPTRAPTATATTAPQPTEPAATPTEPAAMPTESAAMIEVMEVMEESKTGSVVIALGELNDSGQSGKATLTARGDRTEVVIEIAAGAAGVAQPIHIHEGKCETLGGVSFALTNLDGGKSTTMIDATLASLRTGKFAINGHKSGDEIATYISCGDLPETMVVTLTELNGSGQDGTATLTARGDETEVVIEIAAGAAGVAQPIHIHEGKCDNLGSVAFALTNLDGGKSTTMVPATLASLHAGNFAINGHKSGDEIATYISCGDIHAAGEMMMDDGSKMESGDSMEAEATAMTSGGETVTSDIQNFQLEDLSVKVGTTVVWTNRDSAPHTATSGTSPAADGTWDTGFLNQGQSGEGIVFDKVGTFVYFCTVHPSMIATVTVTA